MDDDVIVELRNLGEAVLRHQSTSGVELAKSTVASVNDLAVWITHFRSVSASDTALVLLSGAQAAALETVANVFLGLGRAAITAMRLQIELILGYTYFKDHSAEWERVGRTGDGFMLFSAVENYHRDIDRTCRTRLTMIERRAPPTLRQVYRILSAHVHGQSPYTLPKASPLESTVLDVDFMKSIVEMQRQTVDALSCFLVAVYGNQWPNLPPKFVSRVSQVLTPRERAQFFSENT